MVFCWSDSFLLHLVSHIINISHYWYQKGNFFFKKSFLMINLINFSAKPFFFKNLYGFLNHQHCHSFSSNYHKWDTFYNLFNLLGTSNRLLFLYNLQLINKNVIFMKNIKIKKIDLLNFQWFMVVHANFHS